MLIAVFIIDMVILHNYVFIIFIIIIIIIIIIIVIKTFLWPQVRHVLFNPQLNNSATGCAWEASDMH